MSHETLTRASARRDDHEVLTRPVRELRKLSSRALSRLAVEALRPPPAWTTEKRPPIYYEEWVYLAGHHPDQDSVWRSHELNARDNYRREDYDNCELGGEA